MSTVSTTINEVIVIGRAERQLIDKAAKLWQRISRWTHASDVEFEDGKTAQEKVGSINGITTDLDDQYDVAASIAAVNSVNEELQYRIGGFRIYRGDDGNIYIIDENAGADSVPKKLGDTDPEILQQYNNGSEFLFIEDTPHVYVFTSFVSGHESLYKGIDIKLPNREEYINIPSHKKDGKPYDTFTWEDQESGVIAEKITGCYIATNASGNGFNVILYLLKNIPAGTIIKKGRNLGVVFK